MSKAGEGFAVWWMWARHNNKRGLLFIALWLGLTVYEAVAGNLTLFLGALLLAASAWLISLQESLLVFKNAHIGWLNQQVKNLDVELERFHGIHRSPPNPSFYGPVRVTGTSHWTNLHIVGDGGKHNAEQQDDPER